MREMKGLSPDAGRGADAGVKGLRKNLLTPRTESPDAGRGADADRGGRFGIMHNVEMLRLAS